jgi:hypothetical protein
MRSWGAALAPMAAATPTASSTRSPGAPPAMRTENVSSMSAPAQKPRPAPVSTMAPTSGSRLASVMAWASSAAIRGVHPFSRSGGAA